MVCSHVDGYKIVHLCWCLVLEPELFLIDIGQWFLYVWLYEHWELNHEIHLPVNAESYQLHIVIQMNQSNTKV